MGNKNVCICLIKATFSLSLWFGHISCQLQSFGISANHLENKRVSACCHCGAEFAAQFFVCKDIFISFAGLHACIFSCFLSGFQTLPSFICCLLIAVSHVMRRLAPLLILEHMFVIICCSSKQKAAM